MIVKPGPKKGRAPKNWFLGLWCWTRFLKLPCAASSNQSVLKEKNSEYSLIRRTDAKVEVPVFWLSDMNSKFTGKVPDTGNDRGEKEIKKMKDEDTSEDEMAEWHNQCNGYGLGKTPGDGEGQVRPVCFSPWDRMNWTQLANQTTAVTVLYTNTIPIQLYHLSCFLMIFLLTSTTCSSSQHP